MPLLTKDPITGKIYDAQKVAMADQLIDKAKRLGPWATIDFIIKRYMELNPDDAEWFRKYTADWKAVQKDEYGSAGRRKGEFTSKIGLRATLMIDANLKNAIEMLCIRYIKEYKGGEKEFWREFCRRYPGFSLAQKI